MNFKLNWDGLGIAASLACAIHCALLPLILTSLPLFGINIIHNEIFEWSMILFAFCIGVYALYHGFIKHHHQYLPVLLFITGFSFLIAKQFSKHNIVLLFIAVALIISAHYFNFRLCHRSRCASVHHKH